MAILPTLDNLRAVLQKVIFVPIVYGFISLIPVFLSTWENSDRVADRLFSVVRSKENMFDFVIVGGGTAGALLASRLAEHYKVLLLEAGGTPFPFETIPALALKFLNHPQTDWSHKTVPQRKACLNSINQQSSWSSGKGLGGTSNFNFMAHVRGHPMDYDKWATITGDPSWSYAGVLPYFKRSETFSGTSNDPEARGHNGELRIRKPSYIGLSEDWVRAGQEMGYPFVDLNGRHEEGFGILQYPMYKGIRQSTYAAFLLPYHKSPRLHIRRYAMVRKILFRDMNNMAYGVEYVRHGHIEKAIATKEVILSAGTLGSAKLLMLSGIGPRGHLEELGIPVRSDLPVGRNLQDHLSVHLGPFFIKEPKSFLFDRDVRPENIVRWLFLGTGPITTTGYQGAASVVSSIAKSQGEGNWPDLHLMLHGQAIHQGFVDAFAYAYSLQEDELMQYYSNAVGRDSFHISVIGARPTSTGQVLLSGSSIDDPLVINPRYLEDNGEWDYKTLLEGVKIAMQIAENTTAFRRMGTEFTKAKLPGCHGLEVGSDSYWDCYIRRFTLTMNNPVGSAALGSVVDSSLRVLGTRGLRVMDASIQPTVVSTGTSASVLMIAEKGADLILKDYGIPDRATDFFDLIFGRNGFIKKNPFLKILQREFDTLNPLRAIFRPFTAPRDSEQFEKERFTRNGRVDNPFLQVISSVFGNNNNNNNQDISVSESSNIGYVNLNKKNYNESVLIHKSLGDDLSNVISKSQWILESEGVGLGSRPTKPTTNAPLIKNVRNEQVQVVKLGGSNENLSSTTDFPWRIPKNKGKGGRRFALLQEILRRERENLVQNSTGNYTNPVIRGKKPVVEVVTFSNNHLNTKENEVVVDAKTKNGVLAKPVAQSVPTVASLFPVFPPESNNNYKQRATSTSNENFFGNDLSSDWDSLFGKNTKNKAPLSSSPSTTNPNPLAGIFKSLDSFQSLMKSFTAKTAAEMDAWKPQRPRAKAVSQNQHLINLNSDNGNNIFGNFFSTLNGNSSTTPTRSNSTNQNNNNPFNFLFDNSLQSGSRPPPPNNLNMFSSWLKTSSSSQKASPNAKDDQKSTWFKPFKFEQQESSWFKPNNNPTSSLFQFPTTATTTPPPQPQPQHSSSPPTNSLNDIFELFFGGLKKKERKQIGETLSVMFPDQNNNIMSFLGPGLKQPSSPSNPKNNKPFNIFGNLFDQSSSSSGNIVTSNGDNEQVLQSILSLGNSLMSLQTKPTDKPVPNIFDNILTAFNPSAKFTSPATTRRPNLLDIFLGG